MKMECIGDVGSIHTDPFLKRAGGLLEVDGYPAFCEALHPLLS